MVTLNVLHMIEEHSSLQADAAQVFKLIRHRILFTKHMQYFYVYLFLGVR